MKVIVVNDCDGHISVLTLTRDNLIKLVTSGIEAGLVWELADAKDLETMSFSQIQEILFEEMCGRSRGNYCDIVEVEDSFNFVCNPFM